MAQKQHNIEVKKLEKLESELVTLISLQNSSILNHKFLEWQKQRNICNKGFDEVLNRIIKLLESI